MNKRTLPAVMLLASMSVAAHAAEIILYENPGFKGRQLSVSGHLPDINSAGFDNRNASVLVRSGTWEVCAEPNFRGFCATLKPNEYRSLDTRFNGRISSAREVGEPVAATRPEKREQAGSIKIFSRAGYRGRGITLDHNTPDFDAVRFNDRASSLIVRRGTWELCSDGGYGGTCQAFEPGRYAGLGPLTREISSARMLGNRNEPRYREGRTPPPAASTDAPRIMLYGRRNFGGRSLVLSSNLADLRRSSFNNGTASINVEGGSWEVCTDLYFRGDCRVLAPGHYQRLDRALHRTISSIRLAAATLEPGSYRQGR